jgi:hypothetical protein
MSSMSIRLTGTNAVRTAAALLAVAVSGGCALERSSLSIDSNSRIPFFGFQFAPRPKPPVYDRSVSRPKPGAEPSAKVKPALLETPKEGAWPGWLGLPTPRPTQPLPRTDVLAGEPAAPKSAADTVTNTVEF